MKKIILGCALIAALSAPAHAQWDTGGGTGDTIADMTTIGTTTWGSGGASYIWTWDTTGVNPTMSVSSGLNAFGSTVAASEDTSTNINGSELVTNGTFTSDLTGWSGANWAYSSGTALHTAGDTAALTQNIDITDTVSYVISFTIAGRTAGTITATVGTVTLVPYSVTTTYSANTSYNETFTATATGSLALSFTPTSDFDGSIDGVSVKQITSGALSALYKGYDADGVLNLELRAGTSNLVSTFLGESSGVDSVRATGNTGIGTNALRELEAGGGNTAVGTYAGYYTTNGDNNVYIGINAGRSGTTATSNTMVGAVSGYDLTTGTFNVGVGYYSLANTTTGQFNTGIGHYAIEQNVTGLYNSSVGAHTLNYVTTNANNALGYNAGRYLNDGSTSLTQPTYSTYIGYAARGSSDTESNAVVIGGNTPLGKGSNTTVIGTSATTKNYIYGTKNDPVQAVTCAADTGKHAETVTPTSSYIEITNQDADGCDITMSETGAVVGDVVTLCVVSNAGTTVDFTDSAGVTELAGNFSAAIDDCITLRYGNTTTWREVSRSNN